MRNDLALDWDANDGRLHCNGVFRASPEEITRWCRKDPHPNNIINHVTNRRHHSVDVWWRMQAAHYRIVVNNDATAPYVRSLFHSRLKSGPLVVPRAVCELERYHVQNKSKPKPTPPPRKLQATTQRSQPPRPKAQPPPPHKIQSPFQNPQPSLAQKIQPLSQKTQPPPQKTSNQMHAHTKTSGLVPVVAKPSRPPLREVSSIARDSGQPLTQANLKRKAESDLQQAGGPRKPAPQSFLNSQEWQPQDTSKCDPFLSQRQKSRGDSSNAQPAQSNGDSLRSLAEIHRKTREPEERDSDSTANTTETEELLKAAASQNEINVDMISKGDDREPNTSDGITDTTSLEGSQDSDSSAEEENADKEADSAQVVSVQSGLASSATLQGPSAGLLVQEAEANKPVSQRVGSSGVTFYHTKKDGWSVLSQWFAFSENRGFLIYGYPKSTSTRWLLPLSRASRWIENDHTMIFYYSQLLHRGLPGTMSKEVAKWRLKTKTQLHQLTLAALDSIRTKLFICLSLNIEGMKSGKLKFSGQRPSFTENKDHETQPWMVEEPQSAFTETSAYQMVMNKWLYSRSKYQLEIASVSPVKRTPGNDDDLIPPRCRVCDHKYRLCTCDFCDACAELEADCACDKCNNCRLRVEFCTCENCDTCKKKYNVERKVYCHCFCQGCGVKYSFECLSPLDSENQFIGLNSTLCECSLSWPQARDLGHRLMKEEKERRKAHAHQEIERAALNRVVKWIQEHEPQYFTHPSMGARRKDLALSDVCGTYELTWELGGDASMERSELLISSDCKKLWGRGRFGSQLHGLFRTNRIPSHTSTEPVQCQMAFQSAGSSWHFDASNEGKNSITLDGIIFLGNGLILMEASGFINENGEIKVPTKPIFGVKTSQECEDVDALKESWFAVHDSCCACTSVKPEANGDIVPALHSQWRPVIGEGSTSPWDETLVDHLVDRLRSTENPPTASTSSVVLRVSSPAPAALEALPPAPTPASAPVAPKPLKAYGKARAST